MKKRVLSLLLALTMCLSLCVPAFAAQPEEIEPNNLGGSYVKKVVTAEYEEWSDIVRVSNNLTTGPAGGSISCTISKKISFESDGSILGLSFNILASVSSDKGYTLNVGANQSAYMGFRARFSVEEGIRQTVSVITGQILSENTYVAKTPLYGDYILVPV